MNCWISIKIFLKWGNFNEAVLRICSTETIKSVSNLLFILMKDLYYASVHIRAEDADIARESNERLVHCYRGKNPTRTANISSAVWTKFGLA